MKQRGLHIYTVGLGEYHSYHLHFSKQETENELSKV